MRRAAGHASSDLTVGPVRLDARAGRVTVNGQPIKLTSHEYRLLSYLMHHTGRIISRGEIVEHLYEQDFDRDSNTIEVFIGRLRKKLGVDIIRTARGLGYAVGADADNPGGAVDERAGRYQPSLRAGRRQDPARPAGAHTFFRDRRRSGASRAADFARPAPRPADVRAAERSPRRPG